jgi:hypothetical protein
MRSGRSEGLRKPMTAGAQAERENVWWTIFPPNKYGGMATEKLRELMRSLT